MNEYKLSAANTQIIKEFLFKNFEYSWDEITQGIMLNTTDAFVYLGQIAETLDSETGEVISYLKGLHFDILSKNELIFPHNILIHHPLNPRHKF